GCRRSPAGRAPTALYSGRGRNLLRRGTCAETGAAGARPTGDRDGRQSLGFSQTFLRGTPGRRCAGLLQRFIPAWSQRPAAGHRAVETDQRHRGAGFALDQPVLGLQLRALGIENLQEIGDAAVETEAGEPGSLASRGSSVLEMLPLALQSGVTHQRVLRF